VRTEKEAGGMCVSGQIGRMLIMSMTFAVLAASMTMANKTKVSIPIDDREESDEEGDETLLAKLRVNRFDLKDLVSSSTDNI
jgi:hypothetical protein